MARARRKHKRGAARRERKLRRWVEKMEAKAVFNRQAMHILKGAWSSCGASLN